MSIIDDIRQSYKRGSSLNKLIYINIGVFLLIQIAHIILILSNSAEQFENLLSILAVPASIPQLGLRPWTPVTYMFLHEGFLHILFNMLWLYWFGSIFIQELGEKKLLGVYLLGGLSGAAMFILFYNIFPYFSASVANAVALGASASVMSVVIAVSFYVPERRLNLVFIGPVKIIYIALVSFILSSVVDFSVNSGGKIAHFGGALFGILFALSYRNGKDITRWFDRIMDSLVSLFRPGKRRMKVTYKRSADDMEYNRQKKEEQKDIDEILDKISKGGYNSLSAAEKERLFRMGNKKP
ncbi:MAG: rhomboid family intramembrane serine protease [Bacteroidota bacterium]